MHVTWEEGFDVVDRFASQGGENLYDDVNSPL